MKISKTLLILFILLCHLFKMNAQPNYSLKYNDIIEGKTARLSNKTAKKSFKKGAHNEGLVHAAQALQKADKKRDISKAQNFY